MITKIGLSASELRTFSHLSFVSFHFGDERKENLVQTPKSEELDLGWGRIGGLFDLGGREGDRYSSPHRCT